MLSVFRGCLCAVSVQILGISLTAADVPWDRVDSAVHAELTRQRLVGVAVGILNDGRVAGVRGYGLADRETNRPVTANTVFNWASNSKPVAALAAMQLVEQGKLDLDADIHRYVPDYPPLPHVITLRKLLCHQSGLPHYSNGPVLPTLHSPREPLAELDPRSSLDRFNRSPLLFEPGTKVSYSSYAYVLASAVIQAAGDEPYASQVERRIVEPLGLKSFQLDLPANGQPHWSAGYVKRPDGSIVIAEEEAHFWKHGAGGYKSNVTDFAAWAEALLNRRLVREDTERQMWTRQPLNNGDPSTWGLGFTLEDAAAQTVSHNGSQNETKTRMVLHRAQRRGLVVMCNCQFADVAALAKAIERALGE